MLDFEKGEVLLVNKPYQWTSFDVVKKIRGAGRISKIGHAGTLDPLATGLLILCTGKKTKEINVYQGWEKEYEGVMLLGKTTPSIDLETEFNAEFSLDGIDKEKIRNTRVFFLGSIQQVPPVYSAVKIEGKRAYKKARNGEEAILSPRSVFIKEFQISAVNLPYVSFRVVCSKGTYIRSLVRDFGEALGIGACLAELKRTRIGEFSLKDAADLQELVEAIRSNESFSRNRGVQES